MVSNNGGIVQQIMIQCLQQNTVITWENVQIKVCGGSRKQSCVYCRISAVRKYVKLPAILWELGVFFSCFLYFFVVFYKREKGHRLLFKSDGVQMWGCRPSVGQFQQFLSQGHREHTAPTWAVPGTWVWPEHRLLGERQYQHTSLVFFLWCLALPSSQAGAPWKYWHPAHSPRETRDSFQKSSMQEGLLGRKWIITDRLPTGLEGIPHLGKHLQETIFRGMSQS